MKQNGPIARMTVNRPEVLNALNRATLEELGSAMERAGENVSIRAIILTGAGPEGVHRGCRYQRVGDPERAWRRASSRGGASTVVHRLQRLGKPVIAAVNGFALGGGCEVALACHLRVGSTKAQLGQPEVNLGVIPGWGGTQRLPRLVGMGRALEILLTGELIGAEEAFRIGLLNRVVEPDQLLPTCEAIAGTIASRGPVAVRLTMDAAQRGVEGGLPTDVSSRRTPSAWLPASSDWREGTAAFLEKREPVFRGE